MFTTNKNKGCQISRRKKKLDLFQKHMIYNFQSAVYSVGVEDKASRQQPGWTDGDTNHVAGTRRGRWKPTVSPAHTNTSDSSWEQTGGRQQCVLVFSVACPNLFPALIRCACVRARDTCRGFASPPVHPVFLE